MPTTKTFAVVSLSANGPDRVIVSLAEVNPAPESGDPFYAGSMSFNVATADAGDFGVNERYAVSFSKL